MRHANSVGLLVAALVTAPIDVLGAEAVKTPAVDIRVTLKSDGDHCFVRGVTILCSDLVIYLRDTLKLPRETTVRLRAGDAASYQSVRKVLGIIEKSGFNHPVAYLAEPESSEDK